MVAHIEVELCVMHGLVNNKVRPLKPYTRKSSGLVLKHGNLGILATSGFGALPMLGRAFAKLAGQTT